jgi:hypothetical protein
VVMVVMVVDLVMAVGCLDSFFQVKYFKDLKELIFELLFPSLNRRTETSNIRFSLNHFSALKL